MSTSLARQIATRMKAKNLSITNLEREASLATHAVRNILRGKTKRPSAEVLQAVADVLGCTIRELLGNKEIFETSDNRESISDILNGSYDHPALLMETIKLINAKITHNKLKLTVQQVLTSIEEIYFHSLQKDPQVVDQDFADWFMELVRG